MNRELQLTDIEGYLPFGLEVINDQMKRPCKIVEANFSTGYVKLEGWATEKHIGHFKPILNSMDNLNKMMTHPDINNGEPFQPLLEMAKMTWPNKQWMLETDDAPEAFKNAPYYLFKNEISNKVYLCYRNGVFISYDEKGALGAFGLGFNSIDLLNKLHFDYKDLIPQGLAIQNPNQKQTTI